MNTTKITYEDWVGKGTKKFGKKSTNWKFKCPACNHVATVQDWIELGAPESAIAFSCVGRYGKSTNSKGGPCNYAGGGLFKLNPIHAIFQDGKIRETFEFAEGNSK